MVPMMAGTIDRRRENSKRSGVKRCSREFGGTRGPEEGMMRDVGRWRGWFGGCGQMQRYFKLDDSQVHRLPSQFRLHIVVLG